MTRHVSSFARKGSKRNREVMDGTMIEHFASEVVIANHDASGSCGAHLPHLQQSSALRLSTLRTQRLSPQSSQFRKRFGNGCSSKRTQRFECSSWEQGILTRLCKLLQDLSPAQRHAVLAKRLSQNQRLKLERWMIARRPSNCRYVAAKGNPDMDPRLRITAMPLLQSFRCKAEKIRLTEGVSSDRPLSVRVGERAPRLVEAVHRNIRRLRGIVRHMRDDGCYYSVSIMVGRLRLLTREDRNYDVVKTYHLALSLVQKRMTGIEVEAFELNFRCHVKAALEEHGLDPKSMGLRFCVCLAALWLPRPLLTSPFSMEGKALDAGLDAWRRLGEARGRVPGRGSVLWISSPEDIGRSWERVRAAYLDIMEEAGHCRDHIACKLAGLERKQQEQQEVQLRRWNCARMAAEEKQQRRFLRHQASEATVAAAILKKRQQAESRMLSAIERLLVHWEWKHARQGLQFKATQKNLLRHCGCQRRIKKLKTVTKRVTPQRSPVL